MIDVENFHRDGYAIVRQALPLELLDNLIAAIDQRVDELARQALLRGKITSLHENLAFERRLLAVSSGRSVGNRDWDCVLFCREFFELIKHPSLLVHLESVLGPEITYQGNSHLRPHMPGTLNPLPWHQDAQFYGRGTEHLVEHMVQVWLPLVDATTENGCIALVPGSHHWGMLPGAVQSDDNVVRSTLDKQAEIHAVCAEYIRGATVVSLPMRKGDFLLFKNLTVHTGTENHSSTIRWSVDMRFESTFGSRPLTDFEQRGYEVMHQRIHGRNYVPLRVRGNKGAETWRDWQERWLERSANNLPAAHLRALGTLGARLESSNIDWQIGGGVAAVLQGVAIETTDIDILTNESGAYRLQELFRDSMVREVAHSTSGYIRSHFGAFELEGVTIEIIGNLQTKSGSGEWKPLYRGDGDKRWLVLGGFKLPVAKLEAVLRVYVEFGRTDRIEQLRKTMTLQRSETIA